MRAPRIRKVRLAYVIRTLHFGGTSRQLLKLVQGHDRSKYDIHIVVISPEKPDMLSSFKEEDVSIHVGRFSTSVPSSVIWLAGIIRRSRFDLVHSFLSRADIVVCLAGLLCGFRRIICSERGNRRTVYSGYGFRHRIVDRLVTFRRAVRICTNSYYSMRKLRELRCPMSKTVVVYNGIALDTQKKERAQSTSFLQKQGAKVVGMVSRLHPVKAPGVFVDTAAKIRNRFPELPVRFVLVGSGPDAALVSEKIQDYGMTGFFVLAGYQSNPEYWISRFDICVLTSLSESLPNSVMEYMAARKPVVASAVGGIPELVKDGSSGILCRAKDSDAFVDAIVWLLKNSAAALKMGNIGYNRLVSEFSMPRVLQQLDDLYSEILDHC